MKKRSNSVCFIVNEGKVLLALIEYSPDNRKWNGIGGFVEEGESPEDAVVREINEETYISVEKKDLIRAMELELDVHLIVFKTNKWSGELKAREDSLKELRWFDFSDIPYEQMISGNDKWLPEILSSNIKRWSRHI